MTSNLQQIKQQGETLTTNLARVQRNLISAREALEAAAGVTGNDPAELASRVLVLEARERALHKAIEANQNEAQQAADIIKSKEYKDGQKKITELEAHITKEADAIFQEIILLRERVTKALDKREDLRGLLRRYGLDMNEAERMNRANGRDVQYLQAIQRMLEQRNQVDEMNAAVRQYTYEITHAKPAPKPAKRQAVKVESRYRDAPVR